MDFPRARKLRFLYLLALAQLVGGPLVLLQLTFFCKLTLDETPRIGMARAAIQAWHSDDFQTALGVGVSTTPGDKKAPARDPQPDPEKTKLPVIPWTAGNLALSVPPDDPEAGQPGKFWTPAWPHAPPGPPPRVA